MTSPLHEDRYVSDDDNESDNDALIEELERQLLGDQIFHFKADRSELLENLSMVHLNRCENGLCNFRDGNVLGKQTGIKFPESFGNAERIRTGIYLAKDTPMGDVSVVPIPPFVEKRLTTTDARLRETHKTRDNECWVIPREIGPLLTLDFKKKGWALSKNYREMCEETWPKFVMVATAYYSNGTQTSFVSPEFEVRSKEQSDKQAASRGLFKTRKRRRTAETEACEVKLRALGANIVQRRSDIRNARHIYRDNISRYDFIQKLVATCHSGMAQSIAQKCARQKIHINKWDIE